MANKYVVNSRALLRQDFLSEWYKKWAPLLKQTEAGKGHYDLESNKFWQNAIMAQALHERGVLKPGVHGVGFGVGEERLPALFASMGVKVTATDQDFTTQEASAWDNGQLAQGANSLNIDGICPDSLFTKNVSYRSVNMNDIPEELNGSFDFLWSNCALGHVGSIDLSIAFIRNSLACLKPGGWAVHTTEANILSNEHTLDNAGTVFFRQRDLLRLIRELVDMGFEVDRLDFSLAADETDSGFTLKPKWGTYHSKILFDGHMATQILILVHKPVNKIGSISRLHQRVNHYISYRRNLLRMRSYLQKNTELNEVLRLNALAQHVSATEITLKPVKKSMSVQLKRGETKKISLMYKNGSGNALFQSGGTFAGTKPTVVSTARPTNRNSIFRSPKWLSNNRPGAELQSDGEYIKPGQYFSLDIELSSQNQKPGAYNERFCLVLEGDGVIPNSEVEINITVQQA